MSGKPENSRGRFFQTKALANVVRYNNQIRLPRIFWIARFSYNKSMNLFKEKKLLEQIYNYYRFPFFSHGKPATLLVRSRIVPDIGSITVNPLQ